MGIRQVVISDISQAEVPEDQHARVLVEHPDMAFPVEIDVSAEEAGKLQSTTLRLVNMTIYEPNVPPRRVAMETKVLDKLFAGVDFEAVLAGARKAVEQPTATARRGRPRGTATAAPKSVGERIDYTAPDRYGQLHRGRITDEESRLVRENRDQASKNREAQGHGPINWDDPKEKARYGL